MSLLHHMVLALASLGSLPMVIVSTVILMSGFPVLVLASGLAAVAGFRGLVCVVVAVYVAAVMLYGFVRLFARRSGHGLTFSWLCLAAAVAPFWLFMVVATAKGSRLGTMLVAIAIASTPTFAVLAVGLVIGRTLSLPPSVLSICAAILVVSIRAFVRRAWKGRHEHILATSRVQ